MIGLGRLNGRLHHNLNRKEFMRYLAIALILLIGVASLLQALGTLGGADSVHDAPNSNYGAGVYGR